MEIRTILPSKKILWKATIVVLILGTVLFFDLRKDSSLIKTTIEGAKERKDLKSKVVSEITYTDSDGDGISDWEEYLWGTDPENFDSDGDGVSDGEEIKSKKEGQGLSSSAEAQNSTALFSQEFFATIIALKESGNLSPEALQNLSNSLVSDVGGNEIENVYGIADIKKGVSVASIYYRDLVEELYSSRTVDFGSELIQISLATENLDPVAASKIGTIGGEYKSLSEKVMEITPPSEMYEIHLALANSLYKTGISLEETALIVSDPVNGVVGLSHYAKYSEEFNIVLDLLEDYFTQKGIIVP